MCRALLRRALAPLTTLALLAPMVLPAPPALASHTRLTPVRAAVQRTTHVRVIGTLNAVVEKPDGTGLLQIYAKAHGTRTVYLTPDTVVKKRTLRVTRSALQKGMYVLATCQHGANGALEAISVHIENRRTRKKK
jgi:hypothetical protein